MNLLTDKIKTTAAEKNFSELRTHAFKSIEAVGLPTTKNEEWKYTSLDTVYKTQYAEAFAQQKNHILKSDVEQLPFISSDDIVIVLENGLIRHDLSSLKNTPQSIIIDTVNNQKNNSTLLQHYNKYVAIEKHPMAALNTGLMQDGVFIHFEKNIKCEKHIFIVNYASSNGEATANYSRLLIVGEENSHANISLVTLTHNEQTKSLNNIVNEIVVDNSANINFDFVQCDNENSNLISNTYVHQERDSRFCITTLSFGNKLTRNNLAIMMGNEHCEAHMYGLIAGRNEQLMDNHTEIYHAKPHCNSNQIYKSILAGKATGVFNGKIFVLEDAQKTNAYQSSKNILMSDEANMYTKPQLEIFADDVKCSHGATTGQMDEQALFYLRARGINKANAQAMLNIAFANNVIDNISNSAIKQYCEARLIHNMQA